MRIYLDLCAIQRPLDTATQTRIVLESEAVLGIITYCDSGQAELLSSEALHYEGEQSTLAIRKEHTNSVLAKAKENISVSKEIKSRAEHLISFGIMPLDALHLALAESGKADYFCTCDDKLLKKSALIKDLSVTTINPVDLIQEIEK